MPYMIAEQEVTDVLVNGGAKSQVLTIYIDLCP